MSPITASGVVVLSIEAGGEAIVANAGLTVDVDDIARVVVTGLGGGSTAPVVSADRHVVEHWRDLLRLMVETGAR